MARSGGVAASAGYVDPLSDPGAFAATATRRFPTLVANALLGVPSELSLSKPPMPFVIMGVVSVCSARSSGALAGTRCQTGSETAPAGLRSARS